MIQMSWPQYLRHECTIEGRSTRLRGQWTEILAILLVSGPDRFVCQSELIEALWPDPDLEPEYAASMVVRAICELRRRRVEIENSYDYGNAMLQRIRRKLGAQAV